MKPAEFADIFDACKEGREWAIANCHTMDDAWATALPEWLVWIATRPGVLDERTLRKFAVWSARQVQQLMDDPRSIAAMDVAERHADRLATDEELIAARDAAWFAARGTTDDSAIDCAKDAACTSTESTALSAAIGSSWSSAEAAARAASRAVWSSVLADREATQSQRDAVRASAKAAGDSAYASARDAQAEWLRANAKPDWERAREMGGAR